MQACCYADVGGHVVDSAAELGRALAAAKAAIAAAAKTGHTSAVESPQLFGFDHVFNPELAAKANGGCLGCAGLGPAVAVAGLVVVSWQPA